MGIEVSAPRGELHGTGVIRDAQGNIKGYFELTSEPITREQVVAALGEHFVTEGDT